MIVFDPSVWMFIFFVVFFAFGYESEKASGGFFMMFAGFALCGVGVLLAGTLLYINTLTGPFGIFIILLGIIKAFFVVEEDTRDDPNTGRPVRRLRRIRKRK